MIRHVLTVLIAILLVPLALLGAASLAPNVMPSLNPFAEEEVDRTGPSVLQSLTEISEFHAASAHYETVVDIERDTAYLPDWVSGERLLYVGKGDVDGVVDFSGLDESRVLLSDDGTAVTIRLPAPTVDKPVLDLENSYVVSHDQGITNRFKGSDLEREAQLTAMEQMTSAATGGSSLVDLAKSNTEGMLRGLLGALGFTTITVTFDGGAR